MTRIGNVDHVLMLLQQQLQRLNASDRGGRPRKPGKVGSAQRQSSFQRVAAIEAREGLSEEDYQRALIRALLIDEMGEALAEDHRFDRVANEVCRIIAGDETTRNLLRDAMAQARQSS